MAVSYSVFFVIAVLNCLHVSILSAFNTSLDTYWNYYMKMHRKNYGIHESCKRRIWENNLDDINRHNSGSDLGLYPYRKGMNEYSDLDHDEFVKRMCGYKSSEQNRTFLPIRSDEKVSDFVDWTKEGFVTEVKNQKDCGSCWAFSTTGALEAQVKKKTGTLVSLSEQNLVDCSAKEGNHGCEGGSMDLAYEYIIKNGGIDTESAYPYTATNERCRFNSDSIGATCSKYMYIPKGDENKLKVSVALIGPINVAIDASQNSFQHYKEGIYYEPECSSKKLNHAVLLVGYGTENGVEYWLAKNSWGTSWGENGYMKISRNKNNLCGIATEASFPII